MRKSPTWIFVIFLLSTAFALPQIATAQSPTTLKDFDPNLRQAVASTPLPKPSPTLNPKATPQTHKDIHAPRANSLQGPSGAGLLKTFFALGFVLATFLALAHLARKTWPPLSKIKLPKEVLQLVASVEFQPKQEWMLLRFGGKLLLVCQQPGKTQLIAEISNQEEIDRIIALCEKPHPSDAAFSGLSLGGILGNSSGAIG